jgi:hypothetical protein
MFFQASNTSGFTVNPLGSQGDRVICLGAKNTNIRRFLPNILVIIVLVIVLPLLRARCGSLL